MGKRCEQVTGEVIQMPNGHWSRWSASLVITETQTQMTDTISVLPTALLGKETKSKECAYMWETIRNWLMQL